MNKHSAVKVHEVECPKHGIYLAFACGTRTTRCPSCVFLEQDSQHFSRLFAEDAGVRDEAHENRLRSSGVPERFLGSRFGNYWPGCTESGTVMRMLEAYVATFEVARADASNLVLLGSSGAGKTHLAVAMLSSLIKRDLRVRYIDSRKKFGFGVETNPPDLIVIDNIGSNLQSHQITSIRDLLMDRYDLMLPSILVSAVGRNTLESVLGNAVLDRLREGSSKIIRFPWESYRRSPAKSSAHR